MPGRVIYWREVVAHLTRRAPAEFRQSYPAHNDLETINNRDRDCHSGISSPWKADMRWRGAAPSHCPVPALLHCLAGKYTPREWYMPAVCHQAPGRVVPLSGDGRGKSALRASRRRGASARAQGSAKTRCTDAVVPAQRPSYRRRSRGGRHRAGAVGRAGHVSRASLL
jgi:hypothetical protein